MPQEQRISVGVYHLSKTFGKHFSLHDINLQVANGEFVFLVGPSGAGKSTLLRMIYMDDFPSSGQVVMGPVVKLATERQHLTSLLKMVVYQVESDLFRLIMPHYKRAENEGRTLIQSVLASAADIDVRETELLVQVAPLSSAHRTRVLAALCGQLNATATVFPGTNLVLRYNVAEVGRR